jgi:hypothetical protein
MRADADVGLCVVFLFVISCLIVACMYAPSKKPKKRRKLIRLPTQGVPNEETAGTLPGPDSYTYLDNGIECLAVRGTEVYDMISESLRRRQ